MAKYRVERRMVVNGGGPVNIPDDARAVTLTYDGPNVRVTWLEPVSAPDGGNDG